MIMSFNKTRIINSPLNDKDNCICI